MGPFLESRLFVAGALALLAGSPAGAQSRLACPEAVALPGFDRGDARSIWRVSSPAGSSDWYSVDYDNLLAGETVVGLSASFGECPPDQVHPFGALGLYPDNLVVDPSGGTPDFGNPLVEITPNPGKLTRRSFQVFDVPDLYLDSTSVHMAYRSVPGDSSLWMCSDQFPGDSSMWLATTPARSYYATSGSGVPALPVNGNWMMRPATVPTAAAPGILLINGATNATLPVDEPVALTFYGENPGQFFGIFTAPPLPVSKVGPLLLTGLNGPLPSATTICASIPPGTIPLDFPLSFMAFYLDSASHLKVSNTATVTFSASSPPPGYLMSMSDMAAAAGSVEAFAVQTYDGNGQPTDLRFIAAPGPVQRFVNSIDLFQGEPRGRGHDRTQTVYLRLNSGEVKQFELVDVEPGGSGRALFLDGSFPVSDTMQSVLERRMGTPNYSTNKEAAKEKKSSSPKKWKDQDLLPDSTKSGTFSEIKLIVYQDNPGKTWNKDYAEAHAATAGVEAFGSTGPNSVINHMKELYDACKCVKTLVFAVHGSQGSFRLGPKDAPFKGPSRVGRHAGQVSPTTFGQQLGKYLCPDPTIKFFSCDMAEKEGTAPATDGQAVMQEIADAACATLEASDEPVTMEGDQASTQGAVHTATKNGGAPTETTPSPAGDLDPCD